MAAEKNNGVLFAIIGAVVIIAALAFFFLAQGDETGTDTAVTQAQAVEETPAENAQQAQADSSAAAQGSKTNSATATMNMQGEQPEAANDNQNAAAQTAPQTDEAEQAAAQAEQPGIVVEPGNPVVAKVDGKEITRVDVYRFIQTMPQNVQQLPASAVYPMAMEQVINTRIVQNKADAANVAETEAYKMELEMAKQQLARNVYLQEQVNERITEDKLTAAYEDYAGQMPQVEERRARHILVESESKAQAVIERLNKGGDFAELAQELSTGPTAPTGGDLGYFAEQEMVPEFSQKVFSMKEGEVTKEPVQTQFGWHVVKLEDVRERPKPTFEQMRPALEAELRRQALTELLEDWRADVEVVQYDINGQPLKEGANVLGIVPQDQQPAAGDDAAAPAGAAQAQ
jgi:peptidyl-prolyl cis-trans isomerase C